MLPFTGHGEARLIRECAAICRDPEDEDPGETILAFSRLMFTRHDIDSAAERIMFYCIDQKIAMSNGQATRIALAALGAVGGIAKNINE